MDLPLEVVGHVASFLPVLPCLFKFKRVCKAWKEALETHIQQNRDKAHLHFGLSDMKLENLTQEQFVDIIKLCGGYTEKITLCELELSVEFITELVHALQESKSPLKELVFAYCTNRKSSEFNLFKNIQTLQGVTAVYNDNFMEDYSEFRLENYEIPDTCWYKQIDLAEYEDNTYLRFVKQYQLERVVSQAEFVSRFYNNVEDDETTRYYYRWNRNVRDTPPFGIYERWPVVQKFMRSLVPTNAIIDPERGYNLGHAYMALLMQQHPTETSHFKSKKEVTDAFEKWTNGEDVADVKLAMKTLIARGLNMSLKSKGKRGATALEMAQKLDGKWSSIFKKYKIKASWSMEDYLRELSGVKKEKTKKKGKKRKHDSDDDDDYESDNFVASEDSGSDHEEKPQTRSKKRAKFDSDYIEY
jgi:hypothetical protein